MIRIKRRGGGFPNRFLGWRERRGEIIEKRLALEESSRRKVSRGEREKRRGIFVGIVIHSGNTILHRVSR